MYGPILIDVQVRVHGFYPKKPPISLNVIVLDEDLFVETFKDFDIRYLEVIPAEYNLGYSFFECETVVPVADCKTGETFFVLEDMGRYINRMKYGLHSSGGRFGGDRTNSNGMNVRLNKKVKQLTKL